MSKRIYIVLAVTAAAYAASLLDYEPDTNDKLIQLPELRDNKPNKNCLCKGPACVCCVDFNITFVDLGGPGCVQMKYLSPEDGFSVKVSYGKSVLHSSNIQGSNPAPICLEVFGKFAQLCAKFTELAPTTDGLRGCLELEPKLLGETQLDFPIGCFKSTAEGMEMDDTTSVPDEPETPEDEESTTEENSDETTTFDAESFLLGVYQTAEQGVAFLSSLLDIPNRRNSTTATPAPETTTPASETSSEASQSRGPKSLKHPNQL